MNEHLQLALHEVEEAFALLPREYELRKAEAEAAVDKWSYSTSRRFDARPYYFDRHGSTPGRTCRQVASTKNRGTAEGFDHEGRLLVERQYNEISFYQSFSRWSEECVEIAHFHHWDNKPINLLRLVYAHGRPAECHFAATAGGSVEQYVWDRDLLSSAKVYYTPRIAGMLGHLVLHHTDELTYGTHGKIQRAEVLWPETDTRSTHRELVYERRGDRIWRRR